jgi:multidrug efflux system outer membrane protein
VGPNCRRPSAETLRNYARIARLRFDNGYTSYIEVLGAECNLFNAELSQAQTKGSLFEALVNLFKTMGGGRVLEVDRVTGTTTGSKISTNGYEVLYANQ